MVSRIDYQPNAGEHKLHSTAAHASKLLTAPVQACCHVKHACALRMLVGLFTCRASQLTG